MDEPFQLIGTLKDFEKGTAKRIIVNDTPVAVFHLDDGIHAIGDTCPHMQASLTFGRLDGHVIACPRHGAMFDIPTGRVLSLPSVKGVLSFPIKIVGDYVYIDMSPLTTTKPEILRFA